MSRALKDFETLCHIGRLNAIREKLGLDRVPCISSLALVEVEMRIDDLVSNKITFNNARGTYDRVA